MRLPQGPRSHPIAQTWRWIREPLEFMDECASRYGEVFRVDIWKLGTVVFLSNPDAIKEVFAGDPELFPAGISNAVLKPFLGENSMLVIDGAEHTRQRKLLSPALHGERMELYGRTMLDLSDDSIDSWPLHKTFPLFEELQGITLQIILRTIFGIAAGHRFAEVFDIVRRATDIATNPLLLFPMMQIDLGPYSPWGKVRRFSAQLDEILLTEVKARQAEQQAGAPIRHDILSVLVAARDDSGAPMSFAELRDELLTMLIAGHETTATALAWTMEALLRDTSLRNRLLDELSTAIEDDVLLPERVAKLPLLDATVREGLRFRPVVQIVARQLQRPMHVGGYDLPPGYLVAPAIYLAHRRPSVFPEPQRFDPERFLRSRPSPSEWFPFGGGHRRCIGAAFAMYEMKMILASLLKRTSMQLPPGYVARPIRRGVILTPCKGVPVTLRERRVRMTSKAA